MSEMAEKKPVEIMDLAKIKIVSAPSISPDGEKVAFVNTALDFEKDEYASDIWMTETKTGNVTQFTAGRGKDSNPEWSPCGGHLAFTSTPKVKEGEEKKKPQLYLINTKGGEARMVTDLEGGVASPKWSPDGKQILFVSNVSPEKKDDEEKSDVLVIKRLRYKYDGQGFFKGRRKHLFTAPVNGGEPRQLTSGGFDVEAPVWMPDGKTIVFISNMEKDADKTGYRHIYRLDARGGDPVKILEENMSLSGLAPSPDGDSVSFVGHMYHKGSASNQDAWVLPLEGGKPRNLTEGFDQNIGTLLSCDVRLSSPNVNPTWVGDYIYFTSTYDGDACLYKVHKNGGKVAKVLGGTDHSVESFTVTEDGKIAYAVLDTVKPIELWLHDGEQKQLTDLNKQYLAEADVQGHEHFKFTSTAGHSVEGWLMKPPGFKPNKKYPMILHIHGGPRGAYGNSLVHEFQILASQGWAVLYINPFGSGGYWEDFQAGLPGHYFEQDYDDLMKAVDEVLASNPWVDKEKLGVTGGSYGGVMTNWIIGHTGRFAAAVTLRSITNWYSFYGCSDIGWTFGKWEIGGTPWLNEEEFMRKSPIRYVQNVTTPTMLIQSEEDHRCPMEQAEQLFTALKMLDVPTEFIRFPGESHGLSRGGKPKHRKERLEHIVRWFKAYLD